MGVHARTHHTFEPRLVFCFITRSFTLLHTQPVKKKKKNSTHLLAPGVEPQVEKAYASTATAKSTQKVKMQKFPMSIYTSTGENLRGFGNRDGPGSQALLRDAGLGEGTTANRHVKDLDAGYQRALQVALAFAGAALNGGGSGGSGGGPTPTDTAAAAAAAAAAGSNSPTSRRQQQRQQQRQSGGGASAARPRQLVLLDEPTGDDMDPALQKTVWGLILARHSGATVVVATRSVSEANALADRVALISHGRVKCCGSPTFLRRLFGLGYRLHVAFKRHPDQNGGHLPPVQEEASSSSIDVSDYSLDVLSLVRRHCPGAEALRGQP